MLARTFVEAAGKRLLASVFRQFSWKYDVIREPPCGANAQRDKADIGRAARVESDP
jgi:hypothetical protein